MPVRKGFDMRMHRGGVGTPKQPDAPGIPGASVPDAGASTAGPRSYGPASKASSKGSSRSPSIAGEVPEAAASPQPSESSAKSASAAGDRLSPKHRAVSRSLTSAPSAFAFGSSSGSAPKVSRSTTGLPSGTPQPFAFGSTAAGKLADSNAEPTPLQLGLGKAADAAASAGNVVGHLFGFSVADSTKARSGFGGGVFGGLGSGFSFAAGSSSAGLPSGIKCSTRGIAAEAAASKEDDEQEEAGEEEKKEAEALHAEVEDQETGDGEDGQTPEKEAEDQGEDKEGGAERDRGNLADADGKPQTADQAAPGHDTQSDTAQEAQGEEDDCRLTLHNLFSEDEDTAAAAAIESDNDVGVGQGHKPANGASGHGVGHADPGSESHAESEVDAGQHAGESEAADDDESLEHVEDDVSHNEQDVTGQGDNSQVQKCLIAIIM